MDSNTCKLYIADVTILNNDSEYEKYSKIVSEERRLKAAKIKARKEKNLSLGAGVLIELAMRDLKLTVDNFCPTMDTDREGEVYYNLSHSGSKAILAACNNRVGCDVEWMGRHTLSEDMELKLSDRFFTRGEYECIRAAHEKADAAEGLMAQALREEAREVFFRIWTLKESIIKAAGKGLAIPLDSFEVSREAEGFTLRTITPGEVNFEEYSLYTEDFGDNYCYSVCIHSNEEYELQTERIDL
ncbi:MAG: 4'-phosphopantetheinyl transferase superfamily protein [Lachnospiraceae bacterium]|nr:4'-phosphopantetheinyl transferase superfamily protein [Lachnospiraceae bacterium]